MPKDFFCLQQSLSSDYFIFHARGFENTGNVEGEICTVCVFLGERISVIQVLGGLSFKCVILSRVQGKDQCLYMIYLDKKKIVNIVSSLLDTLLKLYIFLYL